MEFTHLRFHLWCLPSLEKTAGETHTQNILKCLNDTELQVATEKSVTLEATKTHRGQFKDSVVTELKKNPKLF